MPHHILGHQTAVPLVRFLENLTSEFASFLEPT